MTPEGLTKKKIDEALKRLGVECWYYKPVSLGMGVHGIPDYIGCYRGKMFAIESKKSGGKPTALQKQQMERIKNAGGVVMVIDGEASLLNFLGLLTYGK